MVGSGDVSASVQLEPWIDWIKRVTQQLEAHMNNLQIDSWIVTWRRKVWRYAARVAAMSPDKWASKVLTWRAEEDARARGRRPGRPQLRWSDEINSFLRDRGHHSEGTGWLVHACEHDLWSSLEDIFARCTS